jgi:hypothetical protein
MPDSDFHSEPDEDAEEAPVPGKSADIPPLTNTELVQLRIRVIALESLMIAILAEGSDRQLQAAREMSDYVAPRPGFTAHPLTVQAADHIADLVDRVIHLQAASTSTLEEL